MRISDWSSDVCSSDLIRYLFRNRPEVNTLMAEVEGIDQDARQVILNNGMRQTYDTLVLATGATHAYFGHDEWGAFAPGLKTLEDATTIRGRILAAFEEAERTSDPQQIGRAHVRTPVTNAHLVCRLLLEKT